MRMTVHRFKTLARLHYIYMLANMQASIYSLYTFARASVLQAFANVQASHKYLIIR